ncbi:MAG TPA: 3-oxoacyl-[acyl-carrier-protein] synthase III C-terminal domain-containing protein, partial [Phnomibacter sp.]|nr:3-oxoacyl-[acyl-carrier-protein] synthase III C-terminal domain-containing protein [Phnomibacter sp.]
DATCLGFITCLDVASRLLDGTRYRNIAIVCSEICSTSLNPADAETYALMGDGAAAIIVSHCPNSQKGVLAAHMQTWPQQALLTQVPAGGHVQHGLTQPPRQDYFFRMEGTSLLKTALRHLKPFTQQLLQMAGLQLHQLSLIVPHQASLNGMQGYAKLMHIDPQILFTNIQQYGNTLSASVGIALHEALQTQKAVPGQTIMLIGTGAGFSIGGLVLQL